MNFDKTMSFKVEKDSSLETKEIMKKVYELLDTYYLEIQHI